MTRDGMIAGARRAHAQETVARWHEELGEEGLPRIVDHIREFLMLQEKDTLSTPYRVM